MGHLGFWSLRSHRRMGRRKGRKGEIEMGHLGFWSLSCHRREEEGKEGGRREEAKEEEELSI